MSNSFIITLTADSTTAKSKENKQKKYVCLQAETKTKKETDKTLKCSSNHTNKGDRRNQKEIERERGGDRRRQTKPEEETEGDRKKKGDRQSWRQKETEQETEIDRERDKGSGRVADRKRQRMRQRRRQKEGDKGGQRRRQEETEEETKETKETERLVLIPAGFACDSLAVILSITDSATREEGGSKFIRASRTNT